jgi:hypothetical protein
MDKSDLKTTDYYFATCLDCGESTGDYADWSEAIDSAEQSGFEVIDGATYCRECAEAVKHRDCDDHPCEDCHGTLIDKATDAYELRMDEISDELAEAQ